MKEGRKRKKGGGKDDGERTGGKRILRGGGGGKGQRKIPVSELEGVEYEKSVETAKGGQGRTQRGMLGMGKSRKTVTGDGVEKRSAGKT